MVYTMSRRPEPSLAGRPQYTDNGRNEVVDLKKVIETLDTDAKKRLKEKHQQSSVEKLVDYYRRRGGGLRALIRDLDSDELRNALTLLDKSELQAVVYGALAFDSKVSEFNLDDKDVAPLSKLRGIMERLCGWSKDSFTEATYEKLIEMLNRFGIDVEEDDFHRLEKDGRKAADKKVRLERMFVG